MKKEFKLDIFKELASGLGSTKEESIWEEEPVGIEEFICGKKFLNLKWNGRTGCRPKILEIAISVVEDKVREVLLLLGKGCLSKDTLITLADGSVCRMDRLYDKYGGKKTFKLLNTDINTNKPLISEGAIKYSGKKTLYEVETECGRRLKVSKNHEIETFNGRKKVEQLKVGDDIAVSKDQRLIEGEWLLTKEEARFLGYMMGDGFTCAKDKDDQHRNRYCFTNGDVEVIEDFIRCLKSIDIDCEPTIVDTYAPNKWGIWFSGKIKNKCQWYKPPKCYAPNASELLKRVGLNGKRSKTKKVPVVIRKSSKELIGEFLVGYWMTDGECNLSNGKRSVESYLGIGSISRRLIYGVRDLLLRLGISVKVRKSVKDIKTEKKIFYNYVGYHLNFQDNKSQARFLKYVKLFSYKGKNQKSGNYRHKELTTAEIEFLPEKVSEKIRSRLIEQFSMKSLDRYRLTGRGKKINVNRYDAFASIIGDNRRFSNGVVHYSKIRSIKRLPGLRDVYDITIKDGGNKNIKNYIANGVIVGNSGKDFLASILHLYGIYKCLCMYKPQGYYGLSPGSPIYFVNVARNEAQARNVFFVEFVGMLEGCPWFHGKYREPTGNTVKFNKKIRALSGNSQAYGWLGYNTIQWVGDELAFFLEKDANEESTSKAEECWEAAYGSCQTRFPDNYKMIGITTPRYDDDFVMHKFEELKNRDDGYSAQAATWDINPNITKEDFKHALARNYRRTMRDFGALPMGIIESFWSDPEFIEMNVCETCRACPIYQNRGISDDIYACREYPDCRANGYRGNGVWADWMIPEEVDTMYCMHFDLSKNKDRLGFCLAHAFDSIKMELDNFELYDRLDEADKGSIKDIDEEDKYILKPLIKIDAIGWIDPRSRTDGDMLKNGEIRYHAVLDKLVLNLKNRGFNIVKITFDQYNSHYIKQQLEDRGFDADLLSLDRTDEVPVQAKLAFTENRIFYPYDKVLAAEAKKLKYVRGKKVDHPGSEAVGGGSKTLGSSKDIWDAVAGTIYNCERDAFSVGHFEMLDDY